MEVLLRIFGVLMWLCAAPSVVAQQIALIGEVDLSFQFSDYEGQTEHQIVSNASRFGVKGQHKLSETTQFVFHLEWQIDLTDPLASGSVTARNQYVGIESAFGRLLVGRNDTVLKQSQGNVDLFSDYQGDIKNRWKGENRLSETLTYITPQFNHFSAGVTYTIDDEVTGASAFSYQLRYGDPWLKKTAWYASMAFDDDVKGVDVLRVIVSTKIADTVIGVGAQRQRVQNTDTDNGWLISAKRKWHKANLKLQLQSMDGETSSSLGVDYPLAENTTVYAWYTHGNEANTVDNQWLAMGIEYKF